MTAGPLSVPIMRPLLHRCWALLQVFVLAELLLTLNADSEFGENSDCGVEIHVRHNTSFQTVVGKNFQINCTVFSCNKSPPTVTWHKLEETGFVPVNVSNGSHMTANWKDWRNNTGMLFLIFQKILKSDSGVYQCQSKDSVSHTIKVSVDGDVGPTNVTQYNNTGGEASVPERPADIWMYVYLAAGIAGFVILVIIISILSMRGCKGKQKEVQSENQHISISMVEQPLQPASVQHSPRESPSAPLPRRSTRRKTPPATPNELPLPRDNGHVYGEAKKGRERPRNTAEGEGSSVVYAALNHQLPVRAAARPRRLREEASEYAAIRIKDPSPTRLN